MALIIYVLWWNKPLDIERPTMIRGGTARELLAWMSMYEPMNKIGIYQDPREEARRIRAVDRHDPFAKSVSRGRCNNLDNAQEAKDLVPGLRRPKQKHIALTDGDELLSTSLSYYDEGTHALCTPSWFVILNPTDIERWKCAAKLFTENPPLGIWMENAGMLTAHNSDWPPLLGRRGKVNLSVWLLLTIAGFLYGGLHALPWSSDFPTDGQKVFWQISVSAIVAFGPLLQLCSLGFALMDFSYQRGPHIRMVTILQIPKRHAICCTKAQTTQGLIAAIPVAFISFATAVVCIAYALGRVYVFIESLVALFHSTPGVFEVPAWPVYFPHIT